MNYHQLNINKSKYIHLYGMKKYLEVLANLEKDQINILMLYGKLLLVRVLEILLILPSVFFKASLAYK